MQCRVPAACEVVPNSSSCYARPKSIKKPFRSAFTNTCGNFKSLYNILNLQCITYNALTTSKPTRYTNSRLKYFCAENYMSLITSTEKGSNPSTKQSSFISWDLVVVTS